MSAELSGFLEGYYATHMKRRVRKSYRKGDGGE